MCEMRTPVGRCGRGYGVSRHASLRGERCGLTGSRRPCPCRWGGRWQRCWLVASTGFGGPQRDGGDDPVERATRFSLRLLAERNETLRLHAGLLEKRLSTLISCHYPRLISAVGIGPHSAAVLLTAIGDNDDRLRGEASFAALCGASPVEYSSGSRQHRRLNRGGNRQANAALHRLVCAEAEVDIGVGAGRAVDPAQSGAAHLRSRGEHTTIRGRRLARGGSPPLAAGGLCRRARDA
ncbi:transposase [Streptomyces sp. RKAG290]|uniref:transposase n=1 Tax=Streptomyces sp. RKAG290 TaxID=2888348 RepID=UPI0035A864AB